MSVIVTQEQMWELLGQSVEAQPEIILENMGGRAAYGEAYDSMLSNMKYIQETSPQFYHDLYLEGTPGQLNYAAGSSSVPTATAVYNCEPVINSETGLVEGTKATPMAQTTTGAGTVKGGAIAGRIPLGTAIAGTLIGAGVGLKEVAQHPKFWNDLSNAVFNDIKNMGRNPIANPYPMNDTVDIIWRMMSDGSIQSYCDKRKVDTIIRNAYAMGAFNVQDQIIPDVTQAGYVECNPGDLDAAYIADAAANAGAALDAGIIFAYLRSAFPTCNTIEARCSYNPDNGYANTLVYCYNVPEGVKQVFDTAGRLSVNVQDSWKLGNVAATTHYGEFESLTHTAGVTASTIGIGVTSSGYSNLGVHMIPKNPAVIYNGTDQLPPSDIDDFWQTFALWLANGFVNRSYDPYTNSYVDTTYIPFTAPENNWQIEPITGDQSRVWTGIYDFVQPFMNPTTTPEYNPSPWIFQSLGNWDITSPSTPTPTPWDNNPKFPQPTPGPIGSSPSIAVPTSGVASGNKLYTVYNPTQAEVDSLGGYLWTQNIIDVISQFFKNNPLEAIISLHMIYCTPSVGAKKNIILGYLDSGVAANTVTSQYEDVDCGDVNVPEFYGNVLDYTGVSIQINLPFIGFRALKAKDIVGKRLHVAYKVDVYTGTCLALLSVITPNSEQLLYTFEGNCSVQIPLTAADRTRLIAGLTTAGISAFTGNPAGVVGGIASIGANIDRSGSFSGNAGAMSVKKPYLVITRAINAQASHYL